MLEYMNTNINHKKKYLKYKKKYITLKNKLKLQAGGIRNDGIFTLTSPDFKNMEYIPKKYAYNAQYPPTLQWVNPPKNTISFALIMDDPDAPKKPYTHWMVWNMDDTVNRIARNDYIEKSFVRGCNDTKTRTKLYAGPAPPKDKTHRYVFTLYALDTMLDVPHNIEKNYLINKMNPHILGTAKLIGLFKS